MSALLLIIGVACIVAAIFGDRLKVSGIDTRFLQSKAWQRGLAGVGAAALLLGIVMRSSPANYRRAESSQPGISNAWAKEVGALFADQRRCSELGRRNDAELAELEVRSTVKESLWVRGHSPKAQDNMPLRELETLSRSSGLAIGQGGAGKELCQ
jgi:hypothetical protein